MERGVRLCNSDAQAPAIACALTEDTKDLVDAEFLSKLRDECVLVNIARGDIVDETALLSALDNNALDYAVLDVFCDEPPSNLGSATRPLGVALFPGNLEAVVSDRLLRNEVELSFFDS